MSPQLRASHEALFPDLTTRPRGARTPRFPNRARVARAQGTHQAVSYQAGGHFQHPAHLSLSIHSDSRYDGAMSDKVMTKERLVLILEQAHAKEQALVFTN